MKRDCHGFVTRDSRVTSQVRVSCDRRDVSRVSHATTTTPHHTFSLVQVLDGYIQDQSGTVTVGAPVWNWR